MKNKNENIVQRCVREYSDVFKEVYAEYLSRHGYHNLTHIEKFLKEYVRVVEEGIIEARESDVFAIVLHDYVYDVQSKNNEHESACIASLIMTNCNFSRPEIDRTIDIIEATAKHESSGDETIDMILDMDCLYLGARNKETYDYAVRRIEREYLEEYSETQWLVGRRDFLLSLLDRDRIFLTDYYHKSHGGFAQNNVERELRRITRTLESKEC